MKRWIAIVVAVIALAIVAFVPVTKTSQLVINAPYYNVYQNLSTAKNWLIWYPQFTTTKAPDIKQSTGDFEIKDSSGEVTFRKLGMTGFAVDYNSGNGLAELAGMLAYGPNMVKTKAVVSRKVPVYKFFWYLVAADNMAETPLYHLKSYVEDTRRYYGFTINKRITGDKLLIIQRHKAPVSGITQTNRAMLAYLEDYRAKNGLVKTAPVQLQYVSVRNDSAEVMLGMPVDKKVAKQPLFMGMPGGKTLVGYYKGQYKNREQLYAAMQRYVADNFLHPQTKPFEVFEMDKLPQTEDTVVDMKVVIPFFIANVCNIVL